MNKPRVSILAIAVSAIIAAVHAALHALNGTTRDEELLKQPAVQFIDRGRAMQFGHSAIAMLGLVDNFASETSDNGSEQLPQKVVCQRCGTVLDYALGLGHPSSVAVSAWVGPLVAIHKTLTSRTRRA